MVSRIITITGNRNLSPADHKIIADKMGQIVCSTKVVKIYFGGARGADSIALESAYHHRTMAQEGGVLIAVVPNMAKHQPIETHHITCLADEIIELKRPITKRDFYAAFHARNRYMVDHSTEVVAFWAGDKMSGTWKTMEYAKAKGLAVEHVQIEGKDK